MTELQITRRPIDALIPYVRNARTHSDAQVAQIAGSIREFGWTNPVLVDGESGIIAGHGRVLAARKLGMDEVPVIELRHMTEAQKRAYVIADNKLAENAGWDRELLALELGELRDVGFDMDLLGFETVDLDSLLATGIDQENRGGLTDDDAVPELPQVPATRRGDLWILGEHRLLCGDSTIADDVTRLMSGELAALFATDPPYLVDYDGTNHPGTAKNANKDWSDKYIEQPHWDDSSQGPDFYARFIDTAVKHAIRDDVAWYCWHASKRQAMLEHVWESFGVLMHQQIIWFKSRPVLTRSVFLWAHEPCLFGWRKGNKPAVNRESFDGWPSTVWEIPSSEIETREHPTSKPVRIFTLPMEMHTKPGDVCYEPFSGSGSQLIAGQKTGRKVYGMELSPQFCDVIVRRWEQYTGQQATLDGDGQTFADIEQARKGANHGSTPISTD